MTKQDKPWIVKCDGLRVAKAETQARAKAIATAMGKQYPSDMAFKVEQVNTSPSLK